MTSPSSSSTALPRVPSWYRPELAKVRKTQTPPVEAQDKQSSPSTGPSSSTDFPSPLNTLRLRPTRQKTRNAVASVVESGSVCLEFLQPAGGCGSEEVEEVFTVSGNGLSIVVDKPHQRQTLSQSLSEFYTYDNLPKKYRKKYVYASRFVDLVKAKTSKIKLVTDRARCSLMENGPDGDFEALFLDGVKIVKAKSSAGSLRISTADGRSYTLTWPLSAEQMEASVHLNNFCAYQRHCSSLEHLLESSGLSLTTFPLAIGRRPRSSPATPETAANQAADRRRRGDQSAAAEATWASSAFAAADKQTLVTASGGAGGGAPGGAVDGRSGASEDKENSPSSLISLRPRLTSFHGSEISCVTTVAGMSLQRPQQQFKEIQAAASTFTQPRIRSPMRDINDGRDGARLATAVAESVARRTATREVAGSNPGATGSNSSPSLTTSSSSAVRRIPLPDVGDLSLLPDGRQRVDYHDGTVLVILPGTSEVEYCKRGLWRHHSKDNFPTDVVLKLKQIEQIMRQRHHGLLKSTGIR